MKLNICLRTLLLWATLASLAGVDRAQTPRTVEMTAQRFTFEPNEITVKKGQPVILLIKSKDVSHGLVIEDLGVRTEVKKGEATEVKFDPETTGTFEGKCAHFCGKGHGSMRMTVHVTD
ncbi:MAG TPA: cupredoxin domain-containing protein [Candidatus Acidoferrum sp.]|nr:cupredoxin domain-containing protein [Candidatus Acidoferrum sp.]